jgi:hypothetical protein
MPALRSLFSFALPWTSQSTFSRFMDEPNITSNRLVGQVINVCQNDKSATGLILAPNAVHRRSLFLGRDRPSRLPEPGTLVSFEAGQKTGRYPRAPRRSRFWRSVNGQTLASSQVSSLSPGTKAERVSRCSPL